MADIIFIAIVLGFSVLTWGLIVLCDRLMGESQ